MINLPLTEEEFLLLVQTIYSDNEKCLATLAPILQRKLERMANRQKYTEHLQVNDE